MILERFWRGFGKDLGRFGEVLERFSRKGLEEAPSPGRGPEAPEETQMRPRRLDKTRKRRGPEKAGKRPQSPARRGFWEF